MPRKSTKKAKTEAAAEEGSSAAQGHAPAAHALRSADKDAGIVTRGGAHVLGPGEVHAAESKETHHLNKEKHHKRAKAGEPEEAEQAEQGVQLEQEQTQQLGSSSSGLDASTGITGSAAGAEEDATSLAQAAAVTTAAASAAGPPLGLLRRVLYVVPHGPVGNTVGELKLEVATRYNVSVSSVRFYPSVPQPSSILELDSLTELDPSLPLDQLNNEFIARIAETSGLEKAWVFYIAKSDKDLLGLTDAATMSLQPPLTLQQQQELLTTGSGTSTSTLPVTSSSDISAGSSLTGKRTAEEAGLGAEAELPEGEEA